MMFACIRNCDVCPFACNRQTDVQVTRNVPSGLPAGLSVSPNENDAESSLSGGNNQESNDNEPAPGVPALSDVQYEVKEGRKSGLFKKKWRIKK